MVVATNGKRMEQEITGLGPVSNDGAESIVAPFTVRVRLLGMADILFHRYSVEAVREKGDAPKGSATKKVDNIESYVYRNATDETICLPGRYLARSMCEAARSHRDPRSARKMAMDLAKAGLLVTPTLAPLLVKGKPTREWDYLDQQRVVVNHAGIPRTRPAFVEGWECEMEITSLLPEYLTKPFVYRLVTDAGRFVGLGDFRPTYGRFAVTNFEDA